VGEREEGGKKGRKKEGRKVGKSQGREERVEGPAPY